MESNTSSKQKSQKDKNIDDSTEKELNRFNPISGLRSMDNGQRQLTVQVRDIEFPNISSTLRSRNPQMSVKLHHEETGEDMAMNLFLDKFCSNFVGDTVTAFVEGLGIERSQIGDIVGEEIEVKVSKSDSGYEVHPVNNHDFSITTSESKDMSTMENLWKAEEYGKAKIIGVNSHRIRKEATINMEVPWCENKQSITLSTVPKNDYSFDSLFECITGHPPVSRDEINQIVGEEIRVNYEGRFGLDNSLKRRMRDRTYSFREFLEDNRDNVKSRFLKNMLYSGIVSFIPPMVFMTVVLLAPLFTSSIAFGLLGFLVLTSLSSAVLTGIGAFSSYKNGNTIGK